MMRTPSARSTRRTHASRGPADLRGTFVRLGRAVLEKDGLDGLSLRRISRLAGVSSGAPFHHFTDKHQLLGEIAGQGFLDLSAVLARAAARAGIDPSQRLERVARAYLAFAARHPAVFMLMFQPQALQGRGSGQRTPDAELLPLAQTLRDVSSGSPRGRANSLPVVGWALLHGLACFGIEGRLPRDAATYVADLIELMALAIGARPTARPKQRSTSPARSHDHAQLEEQHREPASGRGARRAVTTHRARPR